MPDKKIGYVELILCKDKIVAGSICFGNLYSNNSIEVSEMIEFSQDGNGFYNLSINNFQTGSVSYIKLIPTEFNTFVLDKIKKNQEYDIQYFKGKIKKHEEFGAIPESKMRQFKEKKFENILKNSLSSFDAQKIEELIRIKQETQKIIEQQKNMLPPEQEKIMGKPLKSLISRWG